MRFETPLCEIAYRERTDKCPQIRHSYTPVYYRLFFPIRESVKKVLEIGIGCQETMIDTPNYKTGASLRMWREFFPNAEIHGADILPETMFEDDRIKTHLCDATDPEQVAKLIGEIGSDIDLVIDDGSHWRRDQINAAKNLMHLLHRKVYYFIEDIEHQRLLLRELNRYHCLLFEGTSGQRKDKMILVRHRKEGI